MASGSTLHVSSMLSAGLWTLDGDLGEDPKEWEGRENQVKLWTVESSRGKTIRDSYFFRVFF